MHFYSPTLFKTNPFLYFLLIHSLFYSSTFHSLFSFVSSLFGLFQLLMDTQFHVLAVDDSIIDRKLIERLLKTSSFQVTAVDSPNKALEYLGLSGNESGKEMVGKKVNMIITDYSMPGMTGYELLKKVKESERFKDIPVVIMSSENIPSRISRCLEDGAEDFFLKPVQLSDVDKLKPHLLRSKARDFCKFQHRMLLTWYSSNSSNTSLYQSCT
ncbi:hypothetical protein KSS87_004559 [Heliosperma pusillum]|nr:hypothetical protein KSS87_004559 [Heliosperma pusillum]